MHPFMGFEDVPILAYIVIVVAYLIYKLIKGEKILVHQAGQLSGGVRISV